MRKNSVVAFDPFVCFRLGVYGFTNRPAFVHHYWGAG